jgi:hypothetical protein
VNRNVRNAAIVLVVAALATAGLIVLGVRQSMGHGCEVCITFEGRTVCRTAQGASEDEATQTATQNACALLASGMTKTVQCQNRQPDKVVCE